MKTTAEMIAVMQAYLEGKEIEMGIHHEKTSWTPIKKSTWNWRDYDYRVAVTKPYINPDHVHPDYKWMATDSDGRTWLYKEQPKQDEQSWYSSKLCVKAEAFTSFKPGTCDWKDSLVNIREELK